MKKYNYVYKVTCLVQESEFFNHYYIGQHSTDNLDDNYCGSGSKIREYIKKYGNKPDITYKKEILAFAETREELNEIERTFIDELKNPLCLNLKPGGYYQEWNEDRKEKISKTLSGRKMPDEIKEKISKSMSGEKNPNYNREFSENHRRKISISCKGRISSFKGKHHNNASKKKLSEQITGRIWINNGIEQHQIRPEDILEYPGFKRGMLKKNRCKIWINNGVEQHLVNPEDISKYQGFVKGMLTKNKIWINNGVVNHIIKQEDIYKYPGFVKGVFKKEKG